MSLRKYSLLAATMICTPLSAWAQDFGGAATLGYGHSSVSGGGGDVSTYTLDAAGSVRFQSGFQIKLEGSFSNVDADFKPNDFSATDFELSGDYKFSSGAFVGGYFERVDLDSSFFGAAGPKISSFGLTGGYMTDKFKVEAYAGHSENSPSLGSDYDFTDYGLNFQYGLSEKVHLGAFMSRSTIEVSGADIDLTAFGFGTTIDFGSGWTGYGGVNRISGDNLNVEATTYGIGVGYDLERIVKLPAYASFEVVRSDVSFFGATRNVDSIRFGLTYEFGNSEITAPLNSVADSVLDPRHNTISTSFRAIRLTF